MQFFAVHGTEKEVIQQKHSLGSKNTHVCVCVCVCAFVYFLYHRYFPSDCYLLSPEFYCLRQVSIQTTVKVCKFTADIGLVASHSDNAEKERYLNWILKEKIERRVAISLKIIIWRKGNTLWILTLYQEIRNSNTHIR